MPLCIKDASITASSLFKNRLHKRPWLPRFEISWIAVGDAWLLRRFLLRGILRFHKKAPPKCGGARKTNSFIALIEGPGQARPAPFLASTPVAPILGRFPFSLARTSGNTTHMGFVPRLSVADSNPRPTAKR